MKSCKFLILIGLLVLICNDYILRYSTLCLAPSSITAVKRSQRGSEIISGVLDREGVIEEQEISFFDITQASIKLFQFVVAKGDPRIRVACQYHLIRKYIKGLNFENALQAYYLSDYPSFRLNYSKYHDVYPLTQLVRALKNLEIGNQIEKYIEQEGNYRFLFKQTNKITKGVDRLGVTGCPEAVWQLQLFENSKYLGRIGINFHVENNKIIVSIVNIQGAVNSKSSLAVCRQYFGDTFNNLLIRKMRHKLVKIFKDKKLIFRGGYNFKNKDLNHVLYKMSFRKNKIPLFLTGKQIFLLERQTLTKTSA